MNLKKYWPNNLEILPRSPCSPTDGCSLEGFLIVQNATEPWETWLIGESSPFVALLQVHEILRTLPRLMLYEHRVILGLDMVCLSPPLLFSLWWLCHSTNPQRQRVARKAFASEIPWRRWNPSCQTYPFLESEYTTQLQLWNVAG